MKDIKFITRYIATLILIFAMSQTYSQDNILYNMRKLPQATEFNPAFQPDDGVYIYLPAISSINIGLINSGSTLEEWNNTKSLNEFINDVLSDYNIFRMDFSTTLLGFGFSVGNNLYINVKSSFKLVSELDYPRGLLGVTSGNYDWESQKNNKISFSGLSGEAMGYLESSLGASYRIDKHLTIGANVKYLVGMINANMTLNNAEIVTSNNEVNITFDADVELNGLPLTFEGQTLDDLEQNGSIDEMTVSEVLNNNGFAFDFGATYDDFFIDNLQISASIIDLGYISWGQSSSFNLKSNYKTSGLDINYLVKDEVSDFLDKEKEIFKKNTKVLTTNSPKTTYLSPKVFIGASYKPLSFIEANILSRTVFSNGHASPSLTLAGTIFASTFISTTVSYSMMNDSYNNIGLGVDLKLGGIQFFLATSNLLAFTMPHTTKTVNFRFGMNLSFGDFVGNKNMTDDEREELILEYRGESEVKSTSVESKESPGDKDKSEGLTEDQKNQLDNDKEGFKQELSEEEVKKIEKEESEDGYEKVEEDRAKMQDNASQDKNE